MMAMDDDDFGNDDDDDDDGDDDKKEMMIHVLSFGVECTCISAGGERNGIMEIRQTIMHHHCHRCHRHHHIIITIIISASPLSS